MPTRRRFQLRVPKDISGYGSFKAAEVYKISATEEAALVAIFEGFVADGDADDLDAVIDPDNAGALAGVTSLNGGPLAGLRNRIINGRFDVWQRGASDFPDRWAVASSAGTAPTLSRQNHAAGQTDVPDGGPHYMRWVATGTSSGTPAIGYRIEDVRTLAGQPAVLSFYARAEAARTVSFRPVQSFGAGGSGGVFGTTYTFDLTTSWQRFEISVSAPSVTGKTIGDGSYLEWRLQGVSGATDQRIDLDLFQLEAGGVATPFEQRPVALELALCQRYFERIKAEQLLTRFADAYALNSNRARAALFYSPKRTAPTITYSAAAHFAVSTRLSTDAVTDVLATDSIGIFSASSLLATASTLTAGDAGNLIANNTTSAYIDISAEL